MAIAPLRDHCVHGVKKHTKTLVLEDPGVWVNEIKQQECWQCKQEEKNRNDAIERQQSADIRFVKQNLIIALREDESFREEVKKLLNP